MESAARFPPIVGVCVVCTFGPGLMVMIVIVMAMAMAMAMVLVIVIVIIVSEVLRQVGWLRQCQHQSFYRLRAFY
jgi:hypothetical protein